MLGCFKPHNAGAIPSLAAAGLDIDKDTVIEIAVIVTDGQLHHVIEVRHCALACVTVRQPCRAAPGIRLSNCAVLYLRSLMLVTLPFVRVALGHVTISTAPSAGSSFCDTSVRRGSCGYERVVSGAPRGEWAHTESQGEHH